MIPIRANGHTFETAIAGEGERLALLLHGFPEHAISWRHQIPLLAGLGYRVWAPNLRGYGNSFRPPNVEDYALDRLLEDVAGLIDASGARSVTLIGHDFGAILAWFFAMRRLRPLERLVTMNGPHPIPFRRELAGRAQRQRSWYVGFFALPVLPEALLGVDGARLVGELFVRSGCDPARFPPEVLERYRNEAARPGALRAMVNWYRAVVRNGTLAFDEAQAQPIEVPTLLVWGENDAALTVETTLGTERYVRDLTVRYLPGVSHFVQQDAPECVNSMLAAFLQGSAVPSAAELATASPATLEPRIPFAPSARSAPAATRIGELLGDERCELTIALRPRRSPQEAAARLALLPPGRRRYVPREDFAAEFGAFPSDAEAMQRWLSAAGIEVGEIDLARRRLVARGSMRALAEAFGATLARYEREGRSYLAREGTLSLPASLHPMVVGVFGFDAREQARAQVRIARTASPTAYAPMRVARAYGFPATSASGATIGFVELGGGYDPAQLAAAFKALGATAPSVVAVSVDGANNAPSGDPNSADGEVQLDLEVAGTVALGAALVVYFGPNTDRGFLDAISAAIHDTQHAPSVVSISWGGPESNYTQQTLSAMDTALADGALLGVTITCAAGDGGSSDGASDGLAHADFPASSPHVLACGGTSLVLANGAIASETVWNDGASGGATGGGVSDVFSLPTWQAKAGVPPSANPGAHVGRGVPDVAASADPEFGYAVQIDGSPLVVGGTSAAAPLWAALIGLANAASGKHAGFVNALLYGAGEKIFRDIVSGNNGAYAADPGWDACTGLGSPQGASVTATLES